MGGCRRKLQRLRPSRSLEARHPGMILAVIVRAEAPSSWSASACPPHGRFHLRDAYSGRSGPPVEGAGWVAVALGACWFPDAFTPAAEVGAALGNFSQGADLRTAFPQGLEQFCYLVVRRAGREVHATATGRSALHVPAAIKHVAIKSVSDSHTFDLNI